LQEDHARVFKAKDEDEGEDLVEVMVRLFSITVGY